MRPQIHAIRVIAKRRLYETLIGPGYYLAVSAGLVAGYFLISGFVRSIDASGFNYEANTLYDLIVRILHGAFGAALLEKLFAEGPYMLTVIIAFSPVLIYLAISSIFKFGYEKKVGAVELLVYGPVDGASCFLAFMVKDMLLSTLSIVMLLAFLFISAFAGNLVLGPTVIFSMLFLFFLSLSIYAYGVLASTITNSSASAIIVFICSMLFFLALIMGTFTHVGNYARSVAEILSWIFQWLSPFFYWNLGMRALEVGNPGMFVLSIVCICGVSAALLFLSGLVLRVRGVRA